MVNIYLVIILCALILANAGFFCSQHSDLHQETKSSPQLTTQTAKIYGQGESSLSQVETRLDSLSNELTGITRALSLLSDKVAQNSSRLQASSSKAQGKPSKNQASPPGQSVDFPPAIEGVFDSGILDENAWQVMAQDITGMNKQENKAFWTKMMAKIEQGELMSTDYQE